MPVAVSQGVTLTGVTISGNLSSSLLHALENPGIGLGLYDVGGFGHSVDLSDSYAIVGVPNNAGGALANTADSGKAYVFDPATGDLILTLDNPNPVGTEQNDRFGSIVRVGNTYAGVVSSELGGINSYPSVVHVYNVSTGQTAQTLNYPGSNSDGFVSMDMTDTHVVVGASLNDDTGANSGKAYVFDIATGNVVYSLDNPNNAFSAADDRFGASVAISDTYVAVGANWETHSSSSAQTQSGTVYVFSMATGNVVYTLENPNTFGQQNVDLFGSTMAMSDNYLAVSAPLEDQTGFSGTGAVYVFDLSTGNLVHTLINPNSNPTNVTTDNYGDALAITDTHVVVGARNELDSNNQTSGKVYVFSTVSGNLLYELDNPNINTSTANDFFGSAVGVSNKYVMVGAPLEDSPIANSGSAYIFNV